MNLVRKKLRDEGAQKTWSGECEGCGLGKYAGSGAILYVCRPTGSICTRCKKTSK